MFNLSQDAANTISLVSNVMLILGAVMALVGTFGTFWSGSVLGQYADERVQTNERLTAEANEKAAQAGVKAAELEKDTAALKLDAENAKAEAERLRLQIKKMQEVRRLSKTQIEAISTVLNSPYFQTDPKFKLGVASVPDAEAQMLALDFIALLRACSIDFYPTPGGRLPRGIAQIDDSATGLALTVQSLLTPRTFAYGHLQRAMNAVGLPIDLQVDPTLMPGDAQINVLRKPAVLSITA